MNVRYFEHQTEPTVNPVRNMFLRGDLKHRLASIWFKVQNWPVEPGSCPDGSFIPTALIPT